MSRRLGLGDSGPEVQRLQQLLARRGYPLRADGDFGEATRAAVVAFQAQNLDPEGEPLAVNGGVGPLTWWSLTHPRPLVLTPPPSTTPRCRCRSWGQRARAACAVGGPGRAASGRGRGRAAPTGGRGLAST
ncbi:peptidoglycan-binding domain-containing protein [Pyxidicoccus sp. 3LG]